MQINDLHVENDRGAVCSDCSGHMRLSGHYPIDATDAWNCLDGQSLIVCQSPKHFPVF